MLQRQTLASWFLLAALAAPATTELSAAGLTARVSVGPDDSPANDFSAFPDISADGRFVAFQSHATNLVSDDNNSAPDVFVYDRDTSETTLISVGFGGVPANSRSGDPALSPDGRYVAFYSAANNLVAWDMNDAFDVFVHDRVTGQTSLVSVSSSGRQGNASSGGASISRHGRYVAFYSWADNLVRADENGVLDVFVHDRVKRTTNRVSVAHDGKEGNYHCWFSPAISADGRHVAFTSSADNLVPEDTNGEYDVFVRDLRSRQTSRVSVSSTAAQGNGGSWIPKISADGRFVTFASSADNLISGDANGAIDIFVRDRISSETLRVSVGVSGAEANDFSWFPAISTNGRFVAFYSTATNLVTLDNNDAGDVFVHDLLLSHTSRVSRTPGLPQADGDSWHPAISGSGRHIAFQSWARNLVPMPNADGAANIFVRDRYLQ